MKRPCVHLYAQCWNDGAMLPFFFRHYDAFVSRYVIFDDGSDEATLQHLQAHPRVEVRPFVRSHADSFVLSEKTLSDHCWKESRGQADWVIVTDLDEQLWHPAMSDHLADCTRQGVTLIPALGFQMIAEAWPNTDLPLADACPFGAPWVQMMKLGLFNPDAIDEIDFALGRHRATPTGHLHTPARDEVLLLHFKYIGLERTHNRHQALYGKLGETDRHKGWAHKYHWSPATLQADWQDVLAHSVDTRTLRDDLPGFAYPLAPWWPDDWRIDAVRPAV